MVQPGFGTLRMFWSGFNRISSTHLQSKRDAMWTTSVEQTGDSVYICIHLPTFSQYDVFFSMDSALTDHQSSYARASGCLLDVMAALVHVMTDFL